MRKFRNTFVLMLMFTLLFAFPLTAEEAAPSIDGDKPVDTAETSKEKEDATEKKEETPEKSDKKEEEKADSKDEAKEEAKADSKDEAKEEVKAESKKEESTETELDAQVDESQETVEETPPEEAAPQVDLKSAVSTEDKADDDEDEDGKEEKPKRFSVFINNDFMNTQDASQPVFRYALTGGFGVRLPWKIGFRFSLGLYTSVAYNRPHSGSNSSGTTGYNALLNKNLTTAAFDGTPMRFALNRPFQLPWKLTLTPAVASTLSITSKYLWNMKIYSKLFLALTLSRSFELRKNLSLSTSIRGMYNVTFNGEEWIGDLAPMKIGRNPQSLIYGANVGLNYKDFSFGIAWTQAFVYLRNGSWENDQNPDFPTNDETDRVRWNTINSLGLNASYSIKGFSFGFSVETAGPWTLYYTGPSWYPFRPDMTTYGLSIGYRYAF